MAEETASAAYEKGQLYMLSIGDIQPDPNQTRKYFDDESLAGLTQSIADKGVLQPILVRMGDMYRKSAAGGSGTCAQIQTISSEIGIVSPNSTLTTPTVPPIPPLL